MVRITMEASQLLKLVFFAKSGHLKHLTGTQCTPLKNFTMQHGHVVIQVDVGKGHGAILQRITNDGNIAMLKNAVSENN